MEVETLYQFRLALLAGLLWILFCLSQSLGSPKMAQQQEQQHWHTTFCGGWWVWVSTLFWFLLLRKSHAHSHAPRRAPIALKHGKQLCFCLLICGCISFFFVAATASRSRSLGLWLYCRFVYFLWLGLVFGYLLLSAELKVHLPF